MASTVVYTTIKSFLQTQFSPMPVLDYDQIEPALEQGTDPFMLLQEIFETEGHVAIGDPTGICVRQEADFLVQCFYPSPESSAAARAQAEAVKDAMRFRTINQVRVTGASPPESGAMNDGLWTRYGCAITVEYDTHIPLP